MAFSLVLLEKLISMMLMALVGYILVKTGILGQPDSRVISLLLVYVLQPCLVLRSLQIELTPDRLHGFIFGGIFASLTMVFSIFFSELAKRRLNLDGVDRATLVYSNVGNLTMPLVSMAPYNAAREHGTRSGHGLLLQCLSDSLPYIYLDARHLHYPRRQKARP